MTEIKIGATHAGETNFSALNPPVKEPGKLLLHDYSVIERTGDGGSVGLGAPYCTMYWNSLTRAQRNALRVFCPGASANVFIYIRSNDAFSTFVSYACIMHWPKTEKWQVDNVIEDFEIKFTNLVVVP